MQLHGEKAQATVWMVAAIMVAMTAAVYMTRMVSSADRRSSAQSVADLAALAGATGGRSAAETVALGNGATVTEWTVANGVVTVAVRRGDAVASASATPDVDGGELDRHRCCLDSGSD